MKNKINEFKKVQRLLFINEFNSEILPLLNDKHVIYYGMGVVNIDYKGRDVDSVMDIINDKVIKFTGDIGWDTGNYFIDTPICVYRFFCILDIDTNKHEQGAPLHKCSEVNIALYRHELIK